MAFDPITAIVGLADTVVKRIWPDASEAEQAKIDLLKTQLAAELQTQAGQLAINQAEASHASLFVAGWRPAFGWVCAAVYAYTFIVYPTAKVILAGLKPEYLQYFPVLSLDEVWPVATGLLGVGTLRTYEKLKGVAR